MKITAGLGSIDDYIPFVRAGADELFCGYVPERWMLQDSQRYPLNRREVLYYNVQIGSESELEILRSMVQRYQVPVTIALNGLFYAPEQYPLIADIVRHCIGMGFQAFIVADIALMLYLKEKMTEPISIHVSGETAEVNHYMIDEMRLWGAERIIFHRKNTLEDMKRIIRWEQIHHPKQPLEYEAFVLNENCHFTGAFCSCLHCDELVPSCRLPYRLDKDFKLPAGQNDCRLHEAAQGDADHYVTGKGGCGLCALWQLRQARVTHLKLVSRGNYSEDTIKDIRQLRRALDILDRSESEEEYIWNMKKALFSDGCSYNCYYPKPERNKRKNRGDEYEAGRN